MIRTPLFASLLLSAGCGSGKIGGFGDDTGGGGDDGGTEETIPGAADPEPDSRLIADIVTWPCGGSDGTAPYLGAYALTTTLEYAPDGLLEFTLPSEGECTAGVSMFPRDAGNAGADVDGNPQWVSSWGQGEMIRSTPGYYYADLLGNQHSCQRLDEMLASGISVIDAGALSDVATPAAGTVEAINVEDDRVSQGLSFGEPLELSWQADGWESSWVQIRMERDGFAYDSVLCNTTGLTEYTLTEDVWALLDEELSVEVINLYVGLQNTDVQELESGLKVDVITRAMYVGVIQD